MVVEDEFVIALALERALAAAGCEVIGPVGRLPEAEAAARRGRLDGAVLDVDLHGDTVSELADRLLRDGVPVLFATGKEAELPERLLGQPRLQKPFALSRLTELAARTFHNRGLRLA